LHQFAGLGYEARGQDGLEGDFHPFEKSGDVQSEEGFGDTGKVGAIPVVEAPGAAGVASAKMFEGDGALNEPLIKFAFHIVRASPDILPDFVGFEKSTGVEKIDSLEVERSLGLGGKIGGMAGNQSQLR
jgi:hypothetical protein